MRTSTEINAEINKAKMMNSCGINYKAFATSDYMKSLESELKQALECESQAEAEDFTDEEFSNLIANIEDMSDRLTNAKNNAEKLVGTKADWFVFDELLDDEDDFSAATLDDVRYAIDFDME
jgi:Zn-dependent oligopeptidase